MRIKSVEIFGFKSENRVARLNLSQGPCSVIFGPNGVGKTTALQVMRAFLSKDESTLLRNKVRKIECLMINENSGAEIFVSAEADGSSGYNWSNGGDIEFDKLKSMTIGVERGIAPQITNINPAIIFDFLYRYKRHSSNYIWKEVFTSREERMTESMFRDEMRELSSDLSHFLQRRNRQTQRGNHIDFDVAHLNISSIKMENIENILERQFIDARYKTTKNIQAALFDTIATLVENPEIGSRNVQATDNFISSLKRHQSRIQAALSGGEDNSFMSIVTKTLDGYCQDDPEKRPEDKPVLINLFENMIRELEAEEENLNAINVILSAFNDRLEFGKKLVVGNGRSAYIEIDEESHSISELSSGERHFLTFLTLVATAGKGRDFIFVDEPEISLNLKWQREILNLMQGILPNCQIIAASHSPSISQDIETLCELEVDKV
ncbi:AAA family ATPase [Phaeobacter sp. BS34]|uniref:AAA family ATPase n=1 Tax=Phaeobacter inhibens TaxID=221822 RepID=UPI00030371CD|nr:AAA family ATPase [Phaeobacter inhibens]